jgi:hypothetical protein
LEDAAKHRGVDADEVIRQATAPVPGQGAPQAATAAAPANPPAAELQQPTGEPDQPTPAQPAPPPTATGVAVETQKTQGISQPQEPKPSPAAEPAKPAVVVRATKPLPGSPDTAQYGVATSIEGENHEAIPARYAVYDMGDITASHQVLSGGGLRDNAKAGIYPTNLQPRDYGEAEEHQKVLRIAPAMKPGCVRNLFGNPQRLQQTEQYLGTTRWL